MKKDPTRPETIYPNIYAVARAEARAWAHVPPALVMAILWAFVLRLTTGKSYEETFHPGEPPAPEYEI